MCQSHCRGKWSAPFGNCTRNPAVCWTPPTADTGPAAQDWPVRDYWTTNSYRHGDTIHADCFQVRVTCTGQGSCSRTQEGGGVCSTHKHGPFLPAGQLAELHPCCCLTVQGYVGGVSSTCNMGKWTPVAGRCWRSPHKCYGLPKFPPGPFGKPWPNDYSPKPAGDTITGQERGLHCSDVV